MFVADRNFLYSIFTVQNKCCFHVVNMLFSSDRPGPVVRALALISEDPGFKTRSDHSLNLILVVPGSTSQLHL